MKNFEEMEEIVLEMFNSDPEWKDLVKGKTVDEIKSIWPQDYNVAMCLVNEDNF